MTPIFDLEYVELRNKLIPLAEQWTNATVGDGKSHAYLSYEQWMAVWTRTFSDRMQSLAIERGLTCGMPHERKALL